MDRAENKVEGLRAALDREPYIAAMRAAQGAFASVEDEDVWEFVQRLHASGYTVDALRDHSADATPDRANLPTAEAKARYNEKYGLPAGACNCHHGSARYCPVHTQADFDAATTDRADPLRCTNCGALVGWVEGEQTHIFDGTTPDRADPIGTPPERDASALPSAPTRHDGGVPATPDRADLREAIESLRHPSFSDDGGWWNAALDAVLAKLAALATSDRADQPIEGGRIDVGRLARLIVSYADLTHETVVNGGDWRDIAKEWSAVVDECRAYLARASTPEQIQADIDAADINVGPPPPLKDGDVLHVLGTDDQGFVNEWRITRD